MYEKGNLKMAVNAGGNRNDIRRAIQANNIVWHSAKSMYHNAKQNWQVKKSRVI